MFHVVYETFHSSCGYRIILLHTNLAIYGAEADVRRIL